MRTLADIEPLLLTQPEVARLLRCSTRHVRRLERRGHIQALRFGEGGRPLYRAEEVDALVKRRR